MGFFIPSNSYKRKVTLINVIVLVTGALIFIVWMFINNNNVRDRLVRDIQVSGVIKEIKTEERSRQFMINNEWISFSGTGEALFSIVTVEDSLAKKAGVPNIKVFRRNQNTMEFRLIKTIKM